MPDGTMTAEESAKMEEAIDGAMDDTPEREHVPTDTLREMVVEAADKVNIDRDELEQHCQYKYGCALDELDEEQLWEARDLFDTAARGDWPESKDGTTEKVTGKAFRDDLIQTKEVKRQFTPDEIEKRKEQLMGVLDRLEDITNARNHFLQKNTAAKNEQEDLLKRLHHEIRDGYESGEREVRIKRDFGSGLRRIFDAKTDQFLGTEPLTAGDRQLDAFDDEAENKRREEEAEATNA